MQYTGERLVTEIFNQTTIEHLHRYAFALQYVKNKKVVDIASGEGYGTNLLASLASEAVGIDIDNEAIDHAKRKYVKVNLTYIQGSTDSIPIKNSSIDIVTSFETIEHHDKHQEMINEIKRILKPDGILIISSPDKFNYSIVRKYSNEFHVKELFFNEFKNLIQNNFKFSIFLNQKVNYSSLIIQNECHQFCEFSGNYNKIEINPGILKPVYNIAMASQNNLENAFSSSFDGEELFSKMIEEKISEKTKIIENILNSKSYKVGKFLVRPLIKLKRLFHA